MMLRRRSRLLVPLVALVVLAAACGGGQRAPMPMPTAGPQMAERAITLETADGVQLAGRLFGDVAAKRVAILAHMFPGRGGENWRPFAQELARRGYLAVTFDFRGYGDSGGSKEIDKIDQDVARVLEWARSNADEQARLLGADPAEWRIFLVGASMGGTASLIVAAEEDVAGVVSLSAPTEFRGLDAREAVKGVAEPKLFLASEWDASAVRSVQYFMDNATEPKASRLFRGSAHGTDMLGDDPQGEVGTAILDFLAAQQ